MSGAAWSERFWRKQVRTAAGSGSVWIANVARTLVSAAPAILPALVRQPSTASRTSAETSLGAADTSGKRFLTETSLAQLTTAQQLVPWLVESVRATPELAFSN